jgi:hypothetical protein
MTDLSALTPCPLSLARESGCRASGGGEGRYRPVSLETFKALP